jgi:hypothetical protein
METQFECPINDQPSQVVRAVGTIRLVWAWARSRTTSTAPPHIRCNMGLNPAHLRRIIGLPACGAFALMGNAMSNHKFKVGQTVNYTPRFIGTVRAGAIFKIRQLLPAEDDELQYRIRSASEPYERVAKESQLNRAA